MGHSSWLDGKDGEAELAKKKKKTKKDLKRWKKQKIQRVIDSTADDDSFLKAIVKYYPEPEKSPYKDRFYQAASRRIRFFLGNGAVKHALRYADYLDPKWPDALLARGVWELVSGDEGKGLDLLGECRYQVGGIEQIPHGDYDPDLAYDAAAQLIRHHEHALVDHQKLRDSVTKALNSENLPRPRFHCASAGLLWKLIRLLIRADKEGPDLPPAYWNQLQQCVKELEEKGIKPDFYHNLRFLIELNRNVKTKGFQTHRALSRLEDMAEELMIRTGSTALYGIHPILIPLENIVRSKVLDWLKRPDVIRIAQNDYPELFLRLLGNNKKLEDLWQYQDFQELVQIQDIGRLYEYIDQELTELPLHEKILIRLSLIHLIDRDSLDPEKDDAHDPFFQNTFGRDSDIRQDILIELTGQICSLVQQVESAEIKDPVLKDLKEVLLEQFVYNEYLMDFGETCLELAENLSDDAECLLNAYIALDLAGTRKALLRRVKKKLEAKIGRLRQDSAAGIISNLLASTIIETEQHQPEQEKRFVESWRNLLKELRDIGVSHWSEVEQYILNDMLERVQLARFLHEGLFMKNSGLAYLFAEIDPEDLDIPDPSLKLAPLGKIFPDREEIELAQRLYSILDKKQDSQKAEIDSLFKKASLAGKFFILQELNLKNSHLRSRDTWMLLAYLLSNFLLYLSHSSYFLDGELLKGVLLICDQTLKTVPRGKGTIKMKNELKRLIRYTLEELLKPGQEPQISDKDRVKIQNFLKRLR